MGRPVEATDEMVVEAGQQLTAAGKRVTGYSLRKFLGTGESSRLEAVWLAHLAATAPAAAAPAPQTPLPHALEAQRDAASTRVAEVLTTLFTKAWACADELAQATVAAEQAVAREKVADAEQRLVDADDCIKQADEKVQEEAARADKAEVLLAEARTELAQAAERHAVLEAEGRTAAGIAASTIADLRAQLATVEAALGQARQESTGAKATAAAVQAEANRMRADLDRARDDLATAADRHAALEMAGRTASDNAANTIADLRVQLAASEAATGLALHQAAAAEEKAAASQAGADRTRSELESLRSQQFEGLQSMVGDLRRRLDQEAVPEPA